eukprot:CAMPEP_0117683968 /NCGR_PEP_ID=MMETSP0804-20121206/20775_1 /TAXON_ID=1074897 /ORGANISM="Tetraselmis astigmatica, Strain CCMP880" /LENGTH=65 /DNA_ID=CAMNT_0005494781 /DNA_START=1505 /DNA_END=1702 /DNA_ORIENTATION=-
MGIRAPLESHYERGNPSKSDVPGRRPIHVATAWDREVHHGLLPRNGEADQAEISAQESLVAQWRL